jgi:hypothetical protein
VGTILHVLPDATRQEWIEYLQDNQYEYQQHSADEKHRAEEKFDLYRTGPQPIKHKGFPEIHYRSDWTNTFERRW